MSVSKKLFYFSSLTHLFTSSYSSSSPHLFLFFSGTASKFSSPTVAATTAQILVWKVSDDKAGGRRKRREKKKKEQEPQVIFRPRWGAQTSPLPHWLSLSFPTFLGNIPFVSQLHFLFPSFCFFKQREEEWSKKHLTSRHLLILHTEPSLQPGEETGHKPLGEADLKCSKKGHMANIWRGF